MKSFGLRLVCLGVLGWFVGCVPKGEVRTAAGTKPPVRRVVPAQACIKGQVVGENGKGVSYVFVRTVPKTTPTVTDAKGYYEFCFIRVSTDGSTQSKKVPLREGTYKVLVKKDGYKAAPQVVAFKGKEVTASALRLVEETKPMAEVSTKGKDLKPTKPTTGIIGPAPKEE